MGTENSDFKGHGSRISKNDCCFNLVCAHSHSLEMYVCAYTYVDIYAHLYTPTQISYYGKYCILNCMQN